MRSVSSVLRNAGVPNAAPIEQPPVTIAPANGVATAEAPAAAGAHAQAPAIPAGIIIGNSLPIAVTLKALCFNHG